MKLTIIIPVFNEEKTIEEVLSKIIDLKIPDTQKEIIVVDDSSTDNSVSKIEKFSKQIKFKRHLKNTGKGAAVRTGIEASTGDFIVIQDADLEYDVNDIPRLLSNINGEKEAIYGTRLKRLPHLSGEENRLQFLIHYLGNRLLSFLTSMLYGQWITDMETCYKLFPRSQVKKINLKSRGFDFEPELTSKLLKKGIKIREIPIKTKPRGYEEGKKLNTVRDGIIALWTLIKYRLVD